jgi:hypothetical protein
MAKLRTLVPSSVLTAAGLAGGFAVANKTHNRRLGGAVWLAAGALCLPRWLAVGALPTGMLSVSYAGAMGGSHPLAKKVGVWPSVAMVSAGMAALAWAVADRRPG